MKLLLFILVLSLAACTTAKKATRYMREHPPVAAELCAEMFPVETSRTDSTEYLTSKRKADSLFSLIEQQRILDSIAAAEIVQTIDRLRLDSMNRDNITICDSLNEELYRYASKEKKRADNLQGKVRELQTAVNNIEPKVEYIRDKAKEAVLQNQLNEAIDEGLSLSRDRDSWKGKYEELSKKNKGKLIIRIPWWILILLGAGLLGVAFRKSIFSLIKGVFMKSIIYLLGMISLLVISSCSTFKDDPGTSVWAEGGWVVFWLPFLASLLFFYLANRQSKSGSSQQNSLGRTIYSDNNVRVYTLWRFWVGVILLLASIGVVIYFNSDWHR